MINVICIFGYYILIDIFFIDKLDFCVIWFVILFFVEFVEFNVVFVVFSVIGIFLILIVLVDCLFIFVLNKGFFVLEVIIIDLYWLCIKEII